MERGCKFCSDYTFLKSLCKAKQPGNKLHDRYKIDENTKLKIKVGVKEHLESL